MKLPIISPETKLMIAAAFIAASAFGGYTVRGWQADAEIEGLTSDHAKAQLKTERERDEVSTKYRKLERDTGNRIQEIVDEATRITDASRQSDTRLRDADQRLRIALHTLRVACGPSRATPGAAVAPGSPAASSPGDLLAYVQGRIDDAANQLAEGLDRSYLAGKTCERIGDTIQTNSRKP